MKYAERTEVSSEKSRAEIERLLTRYGATGFYYAWQDGSAAVGFQMKGRNVLFRLAMPSPQDKAFTRTTRGLARSDPAARGLYEQAVRQRWRALLLVVKAKLEAISARISTFDDEFMSFIVTPDGTRVGDTVRPLIEEAYRTGQTPKLLPFAPTKTA